MSERVIQALVEYQRHMELVEIKSHSCTEIDESYQKLQDVMSLLSDEEGDEFTNMLNKDSKTFKAVCSSDCDCHH